ncbi:MAG: hypothetical protein AAGG75_27690 [Bacteroidota bacterium]
MSTKAPLSSLFLAIILVLSFTTNATGQQLQERWLLWHLPALDTEINGVGLSIIANSLKYEGDSLTTRLNGLSVELLGAGLFLPLSPGEPLYTEPSAFYQDPVRLDSLVHAASDYKNYQVNGIAIAGGGIGSPELVVNGLALSGLWSMTGKVSGIVIAPFVSMSTATNGIAIGGIYNKTIQSKGLQIGLINTTKRLRGIQIGLINRNEKRTLPFINWNFGKKSGRNKTD